MKHTVILILAFIIVTGPALAVAQLTGNSPAPLPANSQSTAGGDPTPGVNPNPTPGVNPNPTPGVNPNPTVETGGGVDSNGGGGTTGGNPGGYVIIATRNGDTVAVPREGLDQLRDFLTSPWGDVGYKASGWLSLPKEILETIWLVIAGPFVLFRLVFRPRLTSTIKSLTEVVTMQAEEIVKLTKRLKDEAAK
jgi:hypothetical protein